MEATEGACSSRSKDSREEGSSPSAGYGTPPATVTTPRKVLPPSTVDPRDDSDQWQSDSEAGEREQEEEDQPRRWGHMEPMVGEDPLKDVVGDQKERRQRSAFVIGPNDESSQSDDLREMMTESARQEHPLMGSGEGTGQDENHLMVAPSDLRRFLEPQFFPNADEQYVFAQEQRRSQPKIVNGYMFGAVLGSGMYSKVKEVVDCVTLARRALKIMKYRRLRKIPNGMENVRREIEIMRKIDHENVVKLYDVFLKFHFDTEQQDVQEQKVYMVLEFCVGTLQGLMEKEKKLSFGETHVVFTQLARGLEYLHSIRVVHKDIKPANILFDVNFTIKICDFGVAEQLDLFNIDGTCRMVQGTPKFQAPELVSGNSTHFNGYKVDIWSLGITLYHMVTGCYPFEGSEVGERMSHFEALLALFDAISKQPLVLPEHLDFPNDCSILLHGMLTKDFNDRFAISDVIASSWYRRQYIEDRGGGRMYHFRTGTRPMSIRDDLDEFFYERVEEHVDDVAMPINAADRTLLNYVGDDGADERDRQRRRSRSRRRRGGGIFACFRGNRSPTR